MQNVTNSVNLPFTYFMYDIPLVPRLSVKLLHFSMIGPTDLLHPSPGTTFQNFPSISDLLPDISKFQHHAKLSSKFSISLSSSLSLSPICCDTSLLKTTIPQAQSRTVQ